MAKSPPDGPDEDSPRHAAPPSSAAPATDAGADARAVASRHALPQPSAEALRRAAPLFAQLMGLGEPSRLKGLKLGSPPGPQEPAEAGSQATVPERLYPLAARLLGGDGSFEGPTQALHPAQPHVSMPPPREAAPAPAAQAPKRPQGFVRKSVPKSDWVPQVLLEDVAQMALFDGGSTPQAGSFVIVFREELLGELQCRIEITAKGELEATFMAADTQTAALLQAHTARLEAQLTGHGLRHVTLKVAEG